MHRLERMMSFYEQFYKLHGTLNFYFLYLFISFLFTFIVSLQVLTFFSSKDMYCNTTNDELSIKESCQRLFNILF